MHLKGKDKEANKKTVLSYLAKENRPLSATDIATNLNGALTKTAITNALDDLATEQRVIEKVYGKQRVFMTLQVRFIFVFEVCPSQIGPSIHVS